MEKKRDATGKAERPEIDELAEEGCVMFEEFGDDLLPYQD